MSVRCSAAHRLVAGHRAVRRVAQLVCIDGKLGLLEDQGGLAGLRMNMHSLLRTLIQAQRNIVKGVQLFLVLQMPLVLQVVRLAEVRFD